MSNTLWHELWMAARFGLIGITATLVHMGVLILLFSTTSFSPLLVNTFAFLTTFGISFVGHYRWTFRSPGNLRTAIRRFFLISSTAFMLNTFVLAILLKAAWVSPLSASLFSIGVIPIVTFSASRFWAFRT